MGSDQHYPKEAPAHRVRVDSFWMDATAVTNEEFARFVDETGHVTFCERPARPEDYPGVPPEALAPASAVFSPPTAVFNRNDAYVWWSYVQGADWRHPKGPASSIEGLAKHPVVHIGYEDAVAYAQRAGKELPSEAEFEFAARGGLDGKPYVWGDELHPGGRMMANTWQGEFPWENACDDGYYWTSPVGSYPANGYGLYDMAGNVWEIVSDHYHPQAYTLPSATVPNPVGPSSEDARQAGIEVPSFVTKGGSFLCSDVWCKGYQPGSRGEIDNESPANHTGFRCVKDHDVPAGE